MSTEPKTIPESESPEAIETREWLYSLEWVLQHGGPERVVGHGRDDGLTA